MEEDWFKEEVEGNRRLCLSNLSLSEGDLEKSIHACEEYFSIFGEEVNRRILSPNLKSVLCEEDYELMFREGILRISKYHSYIKEKIGQKEEKINPFNFENSSGDLNNLLCALSRFETLIYNCPDEKIISCSKEHYSGINHVLSLNEGYSLQKRISLSKFARRYSEDNQIKLNLAKLHLESGNIEDCFNEGLIPIQENKSYFEFGSEDHNLYNIILARALYHKYLIKKENNLEISTEGKKVLDDGILNDLMFDKNNKVKFVKPSDYRVYSLFARFILEERDINTFSYVNDSSLENQLSFSLPEEINLQPKPSGSYLDAMKSLLHSVSLRFQYSCSSRNKDKDEDKNLSLLLSLFKHFTMTDYDDSQKYELFSELWSIDESHDFSFVRKINFSENRTSLLILGRLFYGNKEFDIRNIERSKDHYNMYFNGFNDSKTGEFKFSNSALNEDKNLLENLFNSGDVCNYLSLVLSDENFDGNEDKLPDHCKYLLKLGLERDNSEIKQLKKRYVLINPSNEKGNEGRNKIRTFFEEIQNGNLKTYWNKFQDNFKKL